MPDVDVRFTNFLIKTDADFNITWRHHFMGQEKEIVYSVNIEFAYSRYTQDFDNRTPTGIAVEKGGTLRVKGATLKGMNVCGEAQMWDGIMIKGDPAGRNRVLSRYPSHHSLQNHIQ